MQGQMLRHGDGTSRGADTSDGRQPQAPSQKSPPLSTRTGEGVWAAQGCPAWRSQAWGCRAGQQPRRRASGGREARWTGAGAGIPEQVRIPFGARGQECVPGGGWGSSAHPGAGQVLAVTAVQGPGCVSWESVPVTQPGWAGPGWQPCHPAPQRSGEQWPVSCPLTDSARAAVHTSPRRHRVLSQIPKLSLQKVRMERTVTSCPPPSVPPPKQASDPQGRGPFSQGWTVLPNLQIQLSRGFSRREEVVSPGSARVVQKGAPGPRSPTPPSEIPQKAFRAGA